VNYAVSMTLVLYEDLKCDVNSCEFEEHTASPLLYCLSLDTIHPHTHPATHTHTYTQTHPHSLTHPLSHTHTLTHPHTHTHFRDCSHCSINSSPVWIIATNASPLCPPAPAPSPKAKDLARTTHCRSARLPPHSLLTGGI
jgi:hypothetical protein